MSTKAHWVGDNRLVCDFWLETKVYFYEEIIEIINITKDNKVIEIY